MDDASNEQSPGGGTMSPGSEGVPSGPNVAGLGDALEAPPEIVDLAVSHALYVLLATNRLVQRQIFMWRPTNNGLHDEGARAAVQSYACMLTCQSASEEAHTASAFSCQALPVSVFPRLIDMRICPRIAARMSIKSP